MALAVANDILNDGKGQLLSKECRFSFSCLVFMYLTVAFHDLTDNVD